MSDLLEHILSEDYVSAAELFEARLDSIIEKKLYEMKKCIQAEAAGGGLSAAEMQARRDVGYTPASQKYGDPRAKEALSPATQRLRQTQKTGEGDIHKLLGNLKSQWKSAKFGERRQAVRMVQQASKQHLASQKPKAEPTPTPAPAATPAAPEKEKIKRPDWAKLSKKTIANVKAQRRADKIQSWKERGQTNKAKRLSRAIGYKKWDTTVKSVANRIANNPILKTLASNSPLNEDSE